MHFILANKCQAVGIPFGADKSFIITLSYSVWCLHYKRSDCSTLWSSAG